MTPEQALNNVDQAAAQVAAPREVHAVLQQSVAVLRRALAENARGSLVENAEQQEQKPPPPPHGGVVQNEAPESAHA